MNNGNVKIEKYDLVREEEEAKLHQARMISEFYTTETWKLLENTLRQLEKNYDNESDKLLNGTAIEVKPKLIALGAKSKCIREIFEKIHKIVADGETILMQRNVVQNLTEGGY